MMRVEALDHVNLVVPDLDAAACFYADVIGLERRDAPPPLTPANAQWMHDAGGRAVIHLNTREAPSSYRRDTSPGPTTGAVHHVALRCAGHNSAVGRLRARGLEFRTNAVDAIGLRQVFLTDPNGVLLELNFFGE